MAPSKKLTLLEAKKEHLFETIQTIYDLSLQVSSKHEVETFLSRAYTVDSLKDNFIKTMDLINELYLAEEIKPDFAPVAAFEELFSRVKYVQNNLNQTAKLEKNGSELLINKLPTLNLINFNGDANNWPIFYENFKTLIHENTRLSNTEKVRYLISCLTDKAKLICAGIIPNGDNYVIIWNSLVEKYQDKRVQAAMYVDQLLNHKSNQSLEIFLERFVTSASALQLLELDSLADFIITHIALKKLDGNTVNLFEQAFRNKPVPSFADLVKFIKEQTKIQMLNGPVLNNINTYKRPAVSKTADYTRASRSSYACIAKTDSSARNHNTCALCGALELHPFYKCNEFKKNTPRTRNSLVVKHNACRNCLGFHNIRQCQSKNRCNVCQLTHHSLLHIDNYYKNKNVSGIERPPHDTNKQPLSHEDHKLRPVAVNASDEPTRATEIITKVFSISSTKAPRHTGSSVSLLPTALVNVYVRNKPVLIRAFLDTGSMSNFITTDCCRRLGLTYTHSPANIKGIGHATSQSLGLVNFSIHSRVDERCVYKITARVIDQITDKLPVAPVDTSELRHLRGLTMADEYFYNPDGIDCLLGSEIFPFLLGKGTITTPNSSVVAVQSTLGYLLMGRGDCVRNNDNYIGNNNNKTFLNTNESTSLEDLVQRFWELDSVPVKTHMSPEDEQCEQLFTSTHFRDKTGRYTVHLPFKHNPSELGDSYAIAKRRLLSLERKLDSNVNLRNDYNATLQDYIQKGYLSQVHNPGSQDDPCYYIPHRAVYRQDKQTSKTRIVLDASCKTSSGKSLNDILLSGPNLQTNIFELLLNFRIFSVAVTADIEKMYFQVNLTPEHRPFQRILYRFNRNEPITVYEFNRVAFGLSSSPYLAMRVLRQLAEHAKQTRPIASYEINNHFYMDDYISSFNGCSEALRIHNELVTLFNSGGFNLHKWVSNDIEFMSKLPSSHKNPRYVDFNTADSADTKIIGLRWLPSRDVFTFGVTVDLHSFTKRALLSNAARLFDPIGLIGPVTAYMKLLVQDCWKSKLGWDDPVPPVILKKWKQFTNELPLLEKIQIPRHVGIYNNSRVSLIGFADASEQCYAAVVYVRVGQEQSNAISVRLLTSKSRLAPLKRISLARLELCAALLLARLLRAVVDNLSKRITIDKLYALTDSTIALTWIHSPAYKYQTFIANRISEINSLLPAIHWFHIAGKQNPADIISRPTTPSALVDNKIWFQAPDWITHPYSAWPITPFNNLTHSSSQRDLEIKNVTLTSVTLPAVELGCRVRNLIERTSNYYKLLKTLMYILRFAKRIQFTSINSDLETVENYFIRYIQGQHFASDIHAIKNNKPCTKGLLKLAPFYIRIIS